jgi:uracil DNA glycosylase
MLSLTNSGIIFILLGAKAHELEPLLGDNHHILKASHPASAAYSNLKEWECDDVFNKVSDVTKKSYNFDIKW